MTFNSKVFTKILIHESNSLQTKLSVGILTLFLGLKELFSLKLSAKNAKISQKIDIIFCDFKTLR